MNPVQYTVIFFLFSIFSQSHNVILYNNIFLIQYASTDTITDKKPPFTKIINPRKNIYFGVDAGNNKIFLSQDNKMKNSFLFGFNVEYYFTKHWSISNDFRYYTTEVSFESGGGSGLFSLPYYSGTFKGDVISFPMAIKWEFGKRQLKGHLNCGYSYNFEITSKYYEYSNNLDPDKYKKQYWGAILGYGFSYFINEKSVIYFNNDFHNGFVEKGYTSSILSSGIETPINRFISIGYKYSFK